MTLTKFLSHIFPIPPILALRFTNVSPSLIADLQGFQEPCLLFKIVLQRNLKCHKQ